MMTWIAGETQDVDIASYDNVSNEFDGIFTYRAIEGCGLPPRTCFDAPDPRANFAAVRNADYSGWDYVVDHRGEKVYSTETGAEIEVTTLGDYPVDTTTLKPAGPHDKWNGGNWVTDTIAEHAEHVAQAESQKVQLTADAEQSIRPLERARQLGIATDEELEALTEWERYSVYLMRVDTSKAPDITWPTPPTV